MVTQVELSQLLNAGKLELTRIKDFTHNEDTKFITGRNHPSCSHPLIPILSRPFVSFDVCLIVCVRGVWCG